MQDGALSKGLLLLTSPDAHPGGLGSKATTFGPDFWRSHPLDIPGRGTKRCFVAFHQEFGTRNSGHGCFEMSPVKQQGEVWGVMVKNWNKTLEIFEF